MSKEIQWKESTIDYSALNKLTHHALAGIAARESGNGVHTKDPEKKKEFAAKGNETLGPEGRKARIAKTNETLGEEGRKERSKKCNDTLGPEGRSARSFKTAIFLKNQALERYKEILALLPDTFTAKDLGDVLPQFNYSHKVGRRLLKSELVEKLPHTGLATKSNPYVYKKVN